VQRERRAGEGRGREIGGHEREPAEPSERRHEDHRIDAPERGSLYSRALESDTHILKRLYGLGEEGLGRLAEDLLSNPRVAEAFSTAIRKAFEAKGRVDRNMQTVLRLLNVPSRADLNKLATRIEALQGSLANLNHKVDALIAERPAPRPKRKKTPPAE
jgi:hypothetical protein